MSSTIKLISILLGTFALVFITSLLFEIPLICRHWTRQGLVMLLMALELALGFIMLYIAAEELFKK